MDIGIITALQTAVAAALSIAGLAKLVDRESVAPFLVAARIPLGHSHVTLRALPIVEIAIGLAVIGLPGVGPSLAACMAAGAFALVLWKAWASGVVVACRCFGSIDSTDFTVLQPLRATVLLVASTGLLAVRLAAGARQPSDQLSAILVGLLCTVAWLLVFAIAGRIVAILHTTRRVTSAYQEEDGRRRPGPRRR